MATSPGPDPCTLRKERRAMPKRYSVQSNLCKGCAICMSACPRDAIAYTGDRNEYGDPTVLIRQELCTGCGACAVLCPDWAIRELERGGPA